MSSPVRILSISDDDGLRFSRELLLKNAGYETQSMSSDSALSIAQAESFDIALICRSVDPERAVSVCDRLRRSNPNLRILCIAPLENRGGRSGGDLEILSGPEPILEAIRQVCNQRTAAREFQPASSPG